MTSGGAGASAQLAISENLKMLPVLVLGLLKNVCTPPVILHCTLAYFHYLGWDSAECPDTPRYKGVLSSSFDIPSIANPHSVHLPNLLCATQHAARGKFVYDIVFYFV